LELPQFQDPHQDIDALVRHQGSIPTWSGKLSGRSILTLVRHRCRKQQQIRQRHGPIMELKLCKDHFSEANELLNDLDTLEAYGITGAPENEPEVVRLCSWMW
jgi:hypothetical protein